MNFKQDKKKSKFLPTVLMTSFYSVTYQPQEHHCLSISGKLPQVVDLERGTDSMDFHYDDKQSTVREDNEWMKDIRWSKKGAISLARKMLTCPSKPNAAPDTSGCKK